MSRVNDFIEIEELILENDKNEILKIINRYALQGFMLPKTPDQIMGLRRYFVVKDNFEVMGGVGLKEWSEKLVELVSLAVSEGAKEKGLGTKLVKRAIFEAERLGYAEIFTLTLRPNIFLRLGFEETSIKSFPEKIWGDCKDCPKMASGPDDPKCDEVALVKKNEK